MFPLRARLAIGLTLIGVATIAVGWYASRSSESLSGQWSPVNAQLAQTLDTLNSNAPSQPINDPHSQHPTEPKFVTIVPSNEVAPEPQLEPVSSDIDPPPQAAETRLNLNAATLAQLENLPGIGPSKANAIIAYREQHGGYRSIEELLDVKGIGQKMLEKLLSEVYVP